METWLSDVNDFVSDEADELSYNVRVAALNLIMVSYYGYHLCGTDSLALCVCVSLKTAKICCSV